MARSTTPRLPIQKDGVPKWLYEVLRQIQSQSTNSSQQIAAIGRGESPTGGGTSGSGVLSHHLLTNLTDGDDHPQYALLRGRDGGQILNGAFQSIPGWVNAAAAPFTQKQRKVAESSWATIAIDNTANVGDVVVLVLSTDNFADDTGYTNHHTSITDTKANTWTKQKEYTASFFSGTRGVCTSIWTATIATALTAGVDTFTANFDASVTAKAIESYRFALQSGLTVSLVGFTSAADQNASTQLTALTISGLAPGQYLFVRATAIEDNQFSYTPSSSFIGFITSTTDHSASTTNGGALATNIGSRGEYLAATASSATTQPVINFTNVPNVGSLMVALALSGSTTGYLTLQSINNYNAAIINLNNQAIDVNANQISFKAVGSSTTLSYIRTADKSWVGPVTVADATDLTKLGAFDASQISTATTRSYILPNWNGTIVAPSGTGLVNQAIVSNGASQPTWNNISSFGSLILHSSLLGLTNDDHPQYLNIGGRGGGQVVGLGGPYPSGNSLDLAFEGRLLIGNNIGTGWVNNREIEFKYKPSAISIVTSFGVDMSSIVTTGTEVAMQVSVSGAVNAAGTTNIRGFFFTSTAQVQAGATVAESLGALIQASTSTSGGVLSKQTGLRVVAVGDGVSASTVPTVVGIDIQLAPKLGPVTTMSGITFNTPASPFGGGTVTNFYGIDFGAAAPYDNAAVAGWSAIRIPAAPANPTGVIRGLNIDDIKSHHVGKFRFGDTAAATHRIEIAAGSTTVAPLLFTSGNLLTVAVAGAVEFLTDKFYGTITTGPARKEFIQGDNAITDAVNIVLGTTTGSKIGTANNQKLSFWNAAPIVQPTTAIAASTFVANTSGIANDTATWDGYTIGQVVKALRNTGLLA